MDIARMSAAAGYTLYALPHSYYSGETVARCTLRYLCRDEALMSGALKRWVPLPLQWMLRG
jgi:hypothetical protein